MKPSKFLVNFSLFFRSLLFFIVILVFLIAILWQTPQNFFNLKSLNVLGSKDPNGFKVQELIEYAAQDIDHGNFSGAKEKITGALILEPNNVYALEMQRKIDTESIEIYEEIQNTLEIVFVQPNWKEAWLKLADLYEKIGESGLALEAREKAKKLTTS